MSSARDACERVSIAQPRAALEKVIEISEISTMSELAGARVPSDGRGQSSEPLVGQSPAASADRFDIRPVVLLVGFDRMFARRVHGAVRDSALVTVAHTAASVGDVAQAFGAQPPDALLVCWEGTDAMQLQAVARAHPDVGVVVLARALTREQGRALVRCGAAAALERGVPAPVLLAAIVLAGHGTRIEPGSVSSGGRGFAQDEDDVTGLSAREAQVLGLLDCGESVARIARLLGVSAETVKSQTRSIYRKLDVHSRVELRERRGGASAEPRVSPSADSAEGAVLRLDCARAARRYRVSGWLRAPLVRVPGR